MNECSVRTIYMLCKDNARTSHHKCKDTVEQYAYYVQQTRDNPDGICIRTLEQPVVPEILQILLALFYHRSTLIVLCATHTVQNLHQPSFAICKRRRSCVRDRQQRAACREQRFSLIFTRILRQNKRTNMLHYLLE
jgi:hypothetical protein